MPKQNTQQSSMDKMMANIEDNYQSIILGLIVFLIAVTAIYRIINNRQAAKTKQTATQTEESTGEEKSEYTDNGITPTGGEKISQDAKTYTVQKGDNLWKISERRYGSGYNFVDVAKANKLANYNRIEKGQKLALPDVKPRTPTKGVVAKEKTSKVTITADTYTVKKGDYLWKIAVGAYGDGYAWPKIAKVNKIRHPNLIYKGQTLNIPR